MITLDGSLRAAFDAQEIKSQHNGFSMGAPQMPPSDEQFNLLAQRVFGANPTVGQMSAIGRIHFESTTLVVSTIKEKVTSDGADLIHLSW